MAERHEYRGDAEGYCWECGENRINVRHVLVDVDDASDAYLSQTVNFGDVFPGMELAERDAFRAGWEAALAAGGGALSHLLDVRDAQLAAVTRENADLAARLRVSS